MVQGRKTSLSIALSPEQQCELESWQRSTTVSAGRARRARIILMLAQGVSCSAISRTVDIERPHIYKWANRFLRDGIHGLSDKPGRGRKPRRLLIATPEATTPTATIAPPVLTTVPDHRDHNNQQAA